MAFCSLQTLLFCPLTSDGAQYCRGCGPRRRLAAHRCLFCPHSRRTCFVPMVCSYFIYNSIAHLGLSLLCKNTSSLALFLLPCPKRLHIQPLPSLLFLHPHLSIGLQYFLVLDLQLGHLLFIQKIPLLRLFALLRFFSQLSF